MSNKEKRQEAIEKINQLQSLFEELGFYRESNYLGQVQDEIRRAMAEAERFK